jgi:hypothetical protein
MKNPIRLTSIILLLAVANLGATTRCADVNCTNATPPDTNTTGTGPSL